MAERVGLAERIMLAVDRLLLLLCCAAMIFFSVLLVYQVFARYILDSPLFWGEELAKFILVHVTFLGAAIAWARRDHITIDVIALVLTPPGRRLVMLVVDLLVLAFSVWAVVAGYDLAMFGMRKKSVALGVPLGIAYMAVPISFLLIALQTLLFIWKGIAGGRVTAPGGVGERRDIA